MISKYREPLQKESFAEELLNEKSTSGRTLLRFRKDPLRLTIDKTTLLT